MDCKLGNRTYNPSEAGLDNHRPDALTKLQKHLPHLMKPEYYQNFSKKMLADIRGTVSSEQMLHFRIDVWCRLFTFFIEHQINGIPQKNLILSLISGHWESDQQKHTANYAIE